MIKSLHIQGYQSHKYTELEFSEGCNIIVGSSDSGKTSVLRALLWLIQNRPGGDAFISTFAKETIVRVEVDGHTIKRHRSKSINSYSLDEVEFTAMGTEVPKEISDVLNIDSVNINRQLDSPFLLSLSAGEVAQHFNKVAKLDKIDTGLQKVNSWIRDINQDITYKTKEADKLTEEVKEFEYLEKFEIEVEVLENQQQILGREANAYKNLLRLTETTQKTIISIEGYSDTIQLEKPLISVLKLIQEKKGMVDERLKLDNLTSRVVAIDCKLKELNDVLSAENCVNDLLGLYGELKDKETTSIKLKALLNNIMTIKVQIGHAEERYDKFHQEFEDNFPDVCPLCNKPK